MAGQRQSIRPIDSARSANSERLTQIAPVDEAVVSLSESGPSNMRRERVVRETCAPKRLVRETCARQKRGVYTPASRDPSKNHSLEVRPVRAADVVANRTLEARHTSMLACDIDADSLCDVDEALENSDAFERLMRPLHPEQCSDQHDDQKSVGEESGGEAMRA